MCVALWSPPLDYLGNSVRGIQFCKVRCAMINKEYLKFFQELVATFNFHQFDSIMRSVTSKEDKDDPRKSQIEVIMRNSVLTSH